ncbi:Uncharacterised protein r2_g3972 [Pycnogonum litorale]
MDRFTYCLILFQLSLILTMNIVLFLQIWKHYYEQVFNQSYGDMITVDTSSFWCNGVTIDGDGSFDVFYVTGNVEMKSGQKKTSEIKRFTLDETNYKIYEFELVKDSFLKIWACVSEEKTYLSVLRNRIDVMRCIADYSEGLDCRGSIVQVPVYESELCSNVHFVEYFDAVKLNIHSTGKYFILVRNYDENSADVHLKLDFSTSVYNVTHSKDKCLNQILCKFDFEFMKTGDVVIEFSSKKDVAVTVQCRLNATVFALSFVVLPVVLSVIITFLICYFLF